MTIAHLPHTGQALIPAEIAVALLTSEGYDPDDIVTLYDSLIAAGLEHPNSANGLTPTELAVLRESLETQES